MRSRPPLLRSRPPLICGRPPPLQGRPQPLRSRPPPQRGRPPPLRSRPPPLRGRPPSRQAASAVSGPSWMATATPKRPGGQKRQCSQGVLISAPSSSGGGDICRKSIFDHFWMVTATQKSPGGQKRQCSLGGLNGIAYFQNPHEKFTAPGLLLHEVEFSLSRKQ